MSTCLVDYSYSYPKELVALYPADRRDGSRLIVLNRSTRGLSHRRFTDIADYFIPGDVLVVNDTKVFPCRLITRRETGGRQEILLLHPISCRNHDGMASDDWQVIINASRKVGVSDAFEFAGLRVTILDDAGPERMARLEYAGHLPDILARIADIPLPPYIKRRSEPLDAERYQTVYAEKTGSVAVPTAGLHFTPETLAALADKGVEIAPVTLHVGPGTFLKVRNGDITKHRMHAERFSIGQTACDIINRAKTENRRISAVGTTATRVLESLELPLAPRQSSTAIFIHPPYRFRMVDRLITNFHQPESTLLMLVSAFAGREFVLSAYATAIREGYRLFSYGDAMLIE